MPTTSLSELVDELLSGIRPLPIVSAGVPVLRRPALPYDGQLAPDQLDRLLAAMRETMHSAPGVGLAAPQIGVPLRLAVIEDPAEVTAEVREARGRVPQPYRVLVNPVYEPIGDGRAAFFEGCLSIPGWAAVVSRPDRIRLRGQDETGRELDEEFTGWPARIVQHETDHLGGVLYLDLAETRSLSTAQAVSDYWSQPTPATAAHALGFPLRSAIGAAGAADDSGDTGATAP
ncbi:peptide deformylase [Streptomyces samsunensis]|uniref:peptide deformylase n=1 Tax=Streptomyces malaysiensis TaxID=92644 RepID=UPI0015837A6B|nr:peptide deformylase [Streptomyces samsunensis]NUH37286.1 peptide deformylase [Streptomyces samsunensis]